MRDAFNGETRSCKTGFFGESSIQYTLCVYLSDLYQANTNFAVGSVLYFRNEERAEFDCLKQKICTLEVL